MRQVLAASTPLFQPAVSSLGPKRPTRSDRPALALSFGWVLGIVTLHIAAGVLLKQSKWIATAHAVGTLGFGLYLAVTSRDLFRVACWGAYAVGAEVLWRLAQALVPWEFGKYAVSLVFLVAFVRSQPRKVHLTPILYLLLLLPAIIPTILQMSLGEGRKQISFNLSGPFSLAICALFFSQLRLGDLQMQRLMAWLVFPVAGIAAAILFGLSSIKDIQFGSESNLAATGGFGPNQVSSVLGLAAMFTLLLVSDSLLETKLRLLLLSLALWFCAHAALSFSRTGLYLLASGVVVAVPFLPLRKVLRPGTIAILCLAVLAGLAAWTYLISFTDGKISERFARTNVTGRDQIASEDLQLWRENPLFGVGVGMGHIERARLGGHGAAAHTEYTRLLSEHGMAGVLAGVCLLIIGMRCFSGGISGFAKAVIVAGACWALLSLAVSAMRTISPAFLIGLASAKPPVAKQFMLTRVRHRRWEALKAKLFVRKPITIQKECVIENKGRFKI